MAKRNKNKLANLVIALVSVVTAVVAFVGLACNFINEKSTLIGYSATTKWNLARWFDAINDMKNYDNIANWQVAKLLLIITAVLLAVMLTLLVIKFLVKHPVIKWSTFAVGIVAAVCGALFMVLTLIGCGALSGGINAISTGVEYSANIGVYLVGIGATVAGISAAIVALRK